MSRHYLVVGGGIVGLATALQLTGREPGSRVTLLEKESQVGAHQTGHNSGVLHAGLYYKPGSIKAKLAVSGIKQMMRFCAEQSIPYEICGKLVVAGDESEMPRLNDLLARGQQNGLRGLRMLNREEMREIEPHVGGMAAVHVPEEGIVDYPAVCRAMQRMIQEQGGEVRTSSQVLKIRHEGPGWRLETKSGDVAGDFLITCAGLQSDLVSELAGERREMRIVPFRGEYYNIKPERQHLVRHLIYPVPDPKFPFLGVHFTRMVKGGVEAGPNAVLALSREGYTWGDIKLGDLADVVSYKGFWNFFRKYPSMSFYEVRRSLSKRLFCASLQRLVPEIQLKDLERGGAGVRAQALAPDGTLVQDFSYLQRENALHLINAPSPAATASLAIADYILDRIGEKVGSTPMQEA